MKGLDRETRVIRKAALRREHERSGFTNGRGFQLTTAFAEMVPSRHSLPLHTAAISGMRPSTVTHIPFRVEMNGGELDSFGKFTITNDPAEKK